MTIVQCLTESLQLRFGPTRIGSMCEQPPWSERSTSGRAWAWVPSGADDVALRLCCFLLPSHLWFQIRGTPVIPPCKIDVICLFLLRKVYGCQQRRGTCTNVFTKSSGKIARYILQQLEEIHLPTCFGHEIYGMLGEVWCPRDNIDNETILFRTELRVVQFCHI